MPKPTRITIRLVGSGADSGDVRLADFIDQLEAIDEALKQTERHLTGKDESTVYYKIVDLTHSSPATVVLEPVRPRGFGVAPGKLANTFVSSLRQIRTRRKPPQAANLAMLESYRDISVPLQRHIQTVEISAGFQKVVPIDQKFVDNLTHIIGPDELAAGSLSGRLERVNLHNKTYFDIFPTVGPKRVRCHFPASLRQQVKQALDSYVTVTGKLRYKQWSPYPHAIDVAGLDTHEPDEQLPTIDDLRGTAPDATGDLNSELFVRMIRDENW